MKSKYRILKTGETVRKGDQYFGEGKWNLVTKQSIGKKIISHTQWLNLHKKDIWSIYDDIMASIEYRRKILKKE